MAGSKFRKGDRVRILSISTSGIVKLPGSKFPGALVRYEDGAGGIHVFPFPDSDLRLER